MATPNRRGEIRGGCIREELVEDVVRAGRQIPDRLAGLGELTTAQRSKDSYRTVKAQVVVHQHQLSTGARQGGHDLVAAPRGVVLTGRHRVDFHRWGPDGAVDR